MKVDRPVKTKHRNMQLDDHEIAQLIVFDELISESMNYTKTSKTVSKKKWNKETKQFDPKLDRVIDTVKVTKNVTDYQKFRKAKKNYIKQLEVKYRSY